MKDTTVYVLGAGCSANYGYPLASGFIPALESFSQSLAGNLKTEKLKCCIDDTVALMRRAKVHTIDALALRIHEGTLDDPKENRINVDGIQNRRILDATLATSALFLRLEQAVRALSLDRYDRLILKLFPGSGSWHEQVHQAGCHVLSFNYDRLFEMAFLDRFKIDTGAELLYGEHILNSGLHHVCGETMGFTENRFSFLKLHGSVGMRICDEWGRPRYYPSVDPLPFNLDSTMEDKRFIASEVPSIPLSRRPQPLIAFPFEKDFIRSGQENPLPFRNYIERVWKRAEQVVSSATKIHFIGYSFHEMDHQSVIGLLKVAERIGRCETLVIQNPPGEAQKICDKLRLEHNVRIPLQPYDRDF